MANTVLDPHIFGWHSCACEKGCVNRIRFCRSRPYLLKDKAKVAWANRIRRRIDRAKEMPEWKLGDHCWYKPR